MLERYVNFMLEVTVATVLTIALPAILFWVGAVIKEVVKNWREHEANR